MSNLTGGGGTLFAIEKGISFPKDSIVLFIFISKCLKTQTISGLIK